MNNHKYDDYKLILKQCGNASMEIFGDSGVEFDIIDGFIYDKRGAQWEIDGDFIINEDIDELSIEDFYDETVVFKIVEDEKKKMHNVLEGLKSIMKG